jgi:hypothetical protein
MSTDSLFFGCVLAVCVSITVCSVVSRICDYLERKRGIAPPPTVVEFVDEEDD